MKSDSQSSFWKKVKKLKGRNACWELQNLRADGYGQLYKDGKPLRAHRVSWELYNGKIPKGLYVCHHCDNRKCVRPSHLFVGTQLDNLQDAVRKGRVPGGTSKGENNGQSKLTEANVRVIKRTSNKTLKELAEKFSVSISTIHRARHNLSWRHVK